MSGVRCFGAKTHVLSLSSTLWYKHFSKTLWLPCHFSCENRLYPVNTHWCCLSLEPNCCSWKTHRKFFYTSAKREPGSLSNFFPTKKLLVAVGTFFFPTSCLDRNWVKQNLERFCLKESINLVELLGLIPSSPSSLQRFQTQQIDPFKTGQTPVLEFLGEQLLHDAEKNLRRGLFSTFTTDSPVPWSHLPWSHPLQLLKRWSLQSSINSASRPVGSKVHAHPWSHRSIPWRHGRIEKNSAAGGFFPKQKFEKLCNYVKMGKNLNPKLFGGRKWKKISEIPPPNFIHQGLNSIKNGMSWSARKLSAELRCSNAFMALTISVTSERKRINGAFCTQARRQLVSWAWPAPNLKKTFQETITWDPPFTGSSENHRLKSTFKRGYASSQEGRPIQ